MARKTIAQAPAGEKTSLDGTEKFPISGSQYSLVSTVLAYIRTAVATLTNKTINLGSNTLTGTTAEFNTALSDGNFATLAGAEVLSSKTLTAPTIADFTNMPHDHQDADDGGTLAEAALALTDVTTNNASAAKHGFLPKLSGDSTLFLNGDGEWTAPTFSGAVYDSDISFSDITTGNADSDSHGFLLKLSMDTAHFLRADGSWQAPPAGGTVYDSDVVFSDTTANNADSDAHGFLPKLSMDSTEFMSGTGEWLTPAGGGGIDSGTSFPGGPSTNDLFYRTDRALLYYYDGTQWLTTTLYQIIPTSAVTPIPFSTSPLSVAYMSPDTDYGMYLVDFQATTAVFGTNDGSNYWTVELKRRNATNTANSITSFNTSGDTASNWVTHDVSINAVLDASAKLIEVVITKTGAPSDLYPTSRLTYRLVG